MITNDHEYSVIRILMKFVLAAICGGLIYLLLFIVLINICPLYIANNIIFLHMLWIVPSTSGVLGIIMFDRVVDTSRIIINRILRLEE